MAKSSSDGVFINILVKGLQADSAAAWPPVDEETLWAEHLGHGRYRIDSIPFLVRNLSLGDVVELRQAVGDERAPVLTRIVERGGHSTYRVQVHTGLDADHQDALSQLLKGLSELGCRIEKASTTFFSIDCPPTTNVDALYELLELGDENDIWDFEEGNYGLK